MKNYQKTKYKTLSKYKYKYKYKYNHISMQKYQKNIPYLHKKTNNQNNILIHIICIKL